MRKPPSMIHVKTGQLTINDVQTIVPFTTLETIQSMNLGTVQALKDFKNGWMAYTVKNLRIKDHYFNITFSFEKEILQEVSFVFQEEAYDLKASKWFTWSEKSERAQAQRFNNWLDVQLAGERNFDWGIVQADYNAKSGFSSVKIRYQKN